MKLCLLLLTFFGWVSWAAESPTEPLNSVVGRWRQIDDKTGNPRSIVRLEEKDGEIVGFVEKGFLRPEEKPAMCEKCPEEFRGKPVVGMKIIWGMKKDGDVYDSGRVLDPDSGEVYRCKLRLSADGKSLNVRGFIGISLFGRSQDWVREP